MISQFPGTKVCRIAQPKMKPIGSKSPPLKQRWLDRRSRLTGAHEPRNLPCGPRECIVPAWWRW